MAYISIGTVVPVPPPPAPPIISDVAINTNKKIDDIMQQSQTFILDVKDSAIRSLGSLGAFNPKLPDIIAPTITPNSVDLPQLGTAPIEPTGTNASFPNAPSTISIQPIANVDLGSIPDYNVATPLLLDIELPDPLDALLPQAPVLGVVPLPVEPSFVLPPVPTLIALNLPAVPTLDLPVFTDTLDPPPLVPNDSFSYSEVAYTSDLLGALNTRILTMVNGASSGLTPQVEDAIWQRGRDREAQVSQRAVEEATRVFAARGFSMPGGVLLRVIQQALQDSMDRDTTLSRDVMVKQGELEQSNFQFSYNAAIALQTQLFGQFNEVQARALDAQKFTFQSVLQLFNAQVQLFQADVQALGVKAQVFETRLRSALAQLEIYKAQLEGQKLIGDLNTQQVGQYSAQIEAVKSLSEVFRTRVEAAKAQIDAQRAQVEIYTAQLTGYDSQVKSKATEYQAYATQVQAELTKTEIFGQQVSAYKNRIDAYGVLVNAKLSAQTMDFRRLQEFPLEVYKQQVATYQTSVAAEATRLQSLVTLFDTRVRSYATVEGAKTANSGLQVEYSKMLAGVSTSAAQLAIQASSANLSAAVSSGETAQSSLRSAGQIAGQLAAAGVAARSAHISLSSNSGDSRSYGVSQSVGFSGSMSGSNSNTGVVSDVTTHKGD